MMVLMMSSGRFGAGLGFRAIRELNLIHILLWVIKTKCYGT